MREREQGTRNVEEDRKLGKGWNEAKTGERGVQRGGDDDDEGFGIYGEREREGREMECWLMYFLEVRSCDSDAALFP